MSTCKTSPGGFGVVVHAASNDAHEKCKRAHQRCFSGASGGRDPDKTCFVLFCVLFLLWQQ
eukprot:10249737-Alexandrium_andersonii.AAC.1